MSFVYNQCTLDVGIAKISAKLNRYFKHQMLRVIDPADTMTFDLFDFWRIHECRYSIVSIVACDLLRPSIHWSLFLV